MARRQADKLIAEQRVTINGEVAAIGARVATHDNVAIDGEVVTQIFSPVTLMLNKPAGYVCSRRPQGSSPTIYELLPDEYRTLKPVGRLDRNSSGLLLLTNDGDFAHQMTHPSFHKQKVYEVTLDTPLQPLHRQMISEFGVMLDDGKSQLWLERLHDGDDTAWRITMSEGRNRQIRRTFAALGYTVTGLHRTKFGSYDLASLPSGHHALA
ncbi:ribosomal large subunit pseudouridine synthase B [Candidatus Saccharibacteria bacterium]|nr:MAG: ribosomal large subunit pseudouridine synthase B [Candidatus Saccharibacteria bacterium]